MSDFDCDLLDASMAWSNALANQLPANQSPANRSPSHDSSSTLFAETVSARLRLQDLFETQAMLAPDAIAAICASQSLTYDRLNRRANQLAHYLQSLGVKPDMAVGICVERSLEMLVGLLAILKAGGAYVPIDPGYPAERIAHILNDAQPQLVLTQTQCLPLLPASRCQTFCLDRDWEKAAAFPDHNPLSPVTANHLAYIIYTSGSTGKPKGVQIEHGSVVNTLLDINARFQVRASDRVLAVCSLCFDLSVYDIFGLLAAGGTIVIPPPAIAPDPAQWVELMAQEQVTIWNSAPPVMQMVADDLDRRQHCFPASLRLVLLSGDWISLRLPDLLRRLSPAKAIEIISLGGATEASIWSIFYPIETVQPDWKSIPYGRPLTHQQVLVLDDALQLLSVGEIGELFIGGKGLARGYHNRPDLNATRFISQVWNDQSNNSPWGGLRSQRLYRTGDLGRYLPDGTIEFLGRVDHQVKIRGFRVELGEIETVLLQHPSVRAAVVIACENRFANQSGNGTENSAGNGGENKQLVAYLVGDRAASSDCTAGHFTSDHCTSDRSTELRQHLQTHLPHYMMPAAFVWLDSLPLTVNGKIDRAALPVLTLQSRFAEENAGSESVAPRNAIERQLAEIWQQFLSVQSIGIRDNFFELGGNSLLAVKLWTEITSQFNLDLPVATLFQAPTIEQLAACLHQPQSHPCCPSWVIIQPGNPARNRPPIFLLHVLGRGLRFCRSMLPYFDPDQPVYGLSTHLSGESVSNRVEDLAMHYAQQIRILQPQGAYFLVGISFGGLVAFEVAQQLQRQGQEVGLLALLDTMLPSAIQKQSTAQQAQQHWRSLATNGWPYLAQKLRDKWVNQIQDMRESVQQLHLEIRLRFYQTTRLAFPEDLQDYHHRQQNMQSGAAYIPEPYSGQITLFRAGQRGDRVRFAIDPSLGWREFAAGGLEVYDVPGTHLGMVEEPCVQVLIQQLQHCIDRKFDRKFDRPAGLCDPLESLPQMYSHGWNKLSDG